MYNFAIIGNENSNEGELWLRACENAKDFIINCDIIDLSRNDWLKRITQKKYDYYLCKPPGISSSLKQLYDERVLIIATVLNLPIYPTLTEILIYENKRFLSFWLEANKIPHPKTFVFYNKEEAQFSLANKLLPLVAKTNIGASGSGVKILKNIKDVDAYLNSAFNDEGISQRWGPNLKKGHIIQRGFYYLIHPYEIKKKLEIYKKKKEEVQKGFVILQEYIKHDFEWRVVAIGDSYFAHKKLKIGEKASGSTLKQYDNPPLKLFDFAKNIMDRFGFYSQAIDMFETNEGQLLVNEMQCIFGQSDPYQMLVNGTPGRYRFIDGKWVFEEGNFNTNESYDLRIAHIINMIQKGIK